MGLEYQNVVLWGYLSLLKGHAAVKSTTTFRIMSFARPTVVCIWHCASAAEIRSGEVRGEEVDGGPAMNLCTMYIISQSLSTVVIGILPKIETRYYLEGRISDLWADVKRPPLFAICLGLDR